MTIDDDETDFSEDGDCQTCGEDLLIEGALYYDGQEIICPSCKTRYWICCDRENGLYLHELADE